jgi:hypothetical protein
MGQTVIHDHLDKSYLNSYNYFLVTEEGIAQVHFYGFFGEQESFICYDCRFVCRILFKRDGTILRNNGKQAEHRILAAFWEFKAKNL